MKTTRKFQRYPAGTEIHYKFTVATIYVFRVEKNEARLLLTEEEMLKILSEKDLFAVRLMEKSIFT